MIDLILLVGRVLLVALLYLFLFAVMKTGIGLVKGQGAAKNARAWTLTIERGSKTLRGQHVSVISPVVVGRAPGSDITIADDIVSGRHARFAMMGSDLTVEDLNSTNGTYLNGQPVHEVQRCKEGDQVQIGDAVIKVGRK